MGQVSSLNWSFGWGLIEPALFAGVALLLDGTPSPLSEYVDPVVWAGLGWYISVPFVVGFLLSSEFADLLLGVTLAVVIRFSIRYRDRFLQIREYMTGEVGRATYLTLLLAVFVTVLEFNTLALLPQFDVELPSSQIGQPADIL